MERKKPNNNQFDTAPVLMALKPYADEIGPYTTYCVTKTAGEILYLPGNPAQHLFAVLQGRIHIQNFNTNGDVYPINTATARPYSSLFGIESIIKRLNGRSPQEIVYDHQAVPFSDSILALFDARAIVDIIQREMQKKSKVQNPFFIYFIEEMRRAELERTKLAQGFANDSLMQRIVTMLIDLQATYGDHIQIKHEDIAGWAASRRESVSALMVNLSTTGIVEQGVGHITICDMERLKKIQQEMVKVSNFKRRHQRGRVSPPLE